MTPEEIFETFAAYIEGKIPKLVRESRRHTVERERRSAAGLFYSRKIQEQ